jgi:prepilin-type processing-associated H-X9-DG protein
MKAKYGKGPTGRDKKVYRCPEQKHFYSYGINWWFTPPHDYARSMSMGFKPSEVARPSKMIFFYELRKSYQEDIGKGYVLNEDAGISNDGQPDGPMFYYGENNPNNVPKDISSQSCYLIWPGPHNNGHNMAFVDGHVSYFTTWNSNKMTFRGDKY